MALATPQTAKRIQINSLGSFMITNINTYNFYDFGINNNKSVELGPGLNDNQFLYVGIGTNIGASTLTLHDSMGATMCVLENEQVAQILDGKLLGLLQNMPISALTSVGSGVPVYAGLTLSIAEFRSLNSGSFLNLREDAGTIRIDTHPNLSVVQISSIGSGLPIYNGPTNGVVTFNTISAGSYISISSVSENYQISATGYSLIGINADLRLTNISRNNVGIVAGDPAPLNTLALSRGTYSSSASGCVVLGYQAGESTQNINSVAIGNQAGQSEQGRGSVALGRQAGQTSQGINTVAIGISTASNTQGAGAVAMGFFVGQTTQGANAIAIGTASTNQGAGAVAIGSNSANPNQGVNAIVIGNAGGGTNQGAGAMAIGSSEGNANQGVGSIAIGTFTGNSSQGFNSVAIGFHSGETSQGSGSVSIGEYADRGSLGQNLVAIGTSSGEILSGDNCVAIGYRSQYTATNVVILGASSNSTNINTVTIGSSSVNNGAGSVIIGSSSTTNMDKSICFGKQCSDTATGSLNLNNMQPITLITTAQAAPMYWNSTPYLVPLFNSVDVNNIFYFKAVNHTYNTASFNIILDLTPTIITGASDNLIYDSPNNRFVANYAASYAVIIQINFDFRIAGSNVSSSWGYMKNGNIVSQLGFLYHNYVLKSGYATASGKFKITVSAGDYVEFPVSLNYSGSPSYATDVYDTVGGTGNQNYILFQQLS